MTRTFIAVSLGLLPLLCSAQGASRQQQYISDEISVTIRDAPRNDAPSLGVISSGARVSVLESLGAESFTRIRAADGRTGWVTSRFVSPRPAAKDRLADVEKQLAQAQEQISGLQAQLASARDQLEKAAPALALAGDNEKLRASLAEQERQSAEAMSRYDQERAKRRTLVTGAALVGGGVLLGLLLPWLGRGKRRRYSDF